VALMAIQVIIIFLYFEFKINKLLLAPEVLLGKKYGKPIDLWSIG
jgi:hypothetical protein